MKSCMERLAIAALLHDVGKFWSRTRIEPPFSMDARDQYGTHGHALWSAYFVERHIGDAEVTAWVRMHHCPDSRESRLIALADRLSSPDPLPATTTAATPEAASLASIFNSVFADDARPARRSSYFPIAAHGDFRTNFMPTEDWQASETDYQRHWEAFETTLKNLEPPTMPLGTWLALYRRFCSRIPAATPTTGTGSQSDINLFDHSRTVAAAGSTRCFRARRIYAIFKTVWAAPCSTISRGRSRCISAMSN